MVVKRFKIRKLCNEKSPKSYAIKIQLKRRNNKLLNFRKKEKDVASVLNMFEKSLSLQYSRKKVFFYFNS